MAGNLVALVAAVFAFYCAVRAASWVWFNRADVPSIVDGLRRAR